MPFFSQCPPPKFRTKLPLIISLFIIYNRKGWYHWWYHWWAVCSGNCLCSSIISGTVGGTIGGPLAILSPFFRSAAGVNLLKSQLRAGVFHFC